MTAQPDAEAASCTPATAPDSEDSDEETGQEELPIASWNQLSIIERVGLDSMELSEEDLETAFSHIALASRCDQYTLTQRLQAEEHARNLAEDNVQLELTRGRETLEMLKGLCLDSERSDILQRMERSLEVLGGTVERISNAAELLGAVHQEARVSRAVKLMVAHVENLKVQHHRNVAELEEVKKRVQQQNSSKTASDPRASPDAEESDSRKKNSHQNGGVRHRVSTTLIPRRLQEKIKRDKKKPAPPGRDSFLPCPSPPRLNSESSCSAMSRDDRLPVDGRPLDPEETPSDTPAVELRPAPPPSRECLALRQLATRKLRNNNSPQDVLRHRHKGKAALSKKKADKEKKSSNIYRRLSVSTGGSSWRPRPLAGWLCRRRRPLLCVCLLLLFGGAALACFLWKLQDEAPEP